MTIERARGHIRVVRGNVGKAHRANATGMTPRPNQPAGWKPSIPESLAEPWLPFDLGNSIKVAILSDLHIPYHSKIAVESAVAYCKKRKPDVLLLNGDFADFYSVSRHQKDPRKRDLKQEIEAVQQGLCWMRSEFGKKCRIVFKLGNHEERWQHWLWNAAPEISDFERMDVKEWINAAKYGVEVVGDQRPIMVGKLPVFHGHELPKGMTSPVSAARGTFMRTMSTMLVSHYHRTSQHSEPDWKHIETATWSIGCLCALNPDYAKINKWNHGHSFVTVDRVSEFHVDNLRMSLNGDVW